MWDNKVNHYVVLNNKVHKQGILGQYIFHRKWSSDELLWGHIFSVDRFMMLDMLEFGLDSNAHKWVLVRPLFGCFRLFMVEE